MRVLPAWFLLAAGLLSLTLGGVEAPLLGKLPDWAQAAARAATHETPPRDAEAWVLLVRREVAYLGHGTVQIRYLRLVKIIKGKGLEEAGFIHRGLREGRYRIKELNGWNLRPDGEVVKLSDRDKATFGNITKASFDTTTAAVALLPRVTEGSLVAFESLEEVTALRNPLVCSLLEQHPVRRWELDARVRDPLFADLKEVRTQVSRTGFAPWITTVQDVQGRGLAVSALPSLPVGEVATPIGPGVLPLVEVRYLDPAWPASRSLESWQTLAGWYQGVFSPKVLPLASGEPFLGDGLPGLQALWRWFGKELNYKQVYLTPERDNVPETSLEVARKRYGDCKDLACLFIALARRAGFEGHPVLARMQDGPILEGELAGPVRDSFDHVIVALRLASSLNLPAEVETPTGRYLLLDPTNPFVPFGRLGEGHRGSRVLICLPNSGQWATVPAGAILQGSLDIHLKGKADAMGSLQAEVLVRETGGMWGLRSRARTLTRTQFRAYLEAQCLDQALNGTCEILGLGDPLDLETPFEVRLGLTDPRGLTLQGSDWLFKPPLGLPSLPPPLTRPGRKRQFPVESRGSGHLVLWGSIELPRVVQPVLAEHSETTSFRSLSWKLKTEPGPSGCTLAFQVEQRRMDASFPFEQLEQGLAAWKKDRALVRALREDGMALKP